MNRRQFVQGMVTTATVAATGTVNAVAAELADDPDVKLRVGVVSDVHIAIGAEMSWNNTEVWEKTLVWYRDQKVDAVVAAGDLADYGQVDQLQNFANSWYKVFPDDKAPDGRHVEKVFVYGNHDMEGWAYGTQNKPDLHARRQEHAIFKDPAAAWEQCFHEKFQPIYAKTVKGYTFIGTHWGNEGALGEFMEGIKSNLDPNLPFFYTQHPHPGNTCYGPWAWGNDGGKATRALNPFPNCIALTGHSHYSLNDESGIWQGAFTSIGTSSLRYVAPREGRENASECSAAGSQMQAVPHAAPQGMLLTVYKDRIVIAKRDFVNDEPVAEDWIIPLPINGLQPYEFKKRKAEAAANPPAFAPNAANEIKIEQIVGKNRGGVETPQVVITFPTAFAGGMTFDYEVRAELFSYDVTRIFSAMRVYSKNYQMAPRHQVPTANCIFSLNELPKQVPLHFTITPIDAFGNRGLPIMTKNLKLEQQ